MNYVLLFSFEMHYICRTNQKHYYSIRSHFPRLPVWFSVNCELCLCGSLWLCSRDTDRTWVGDWLKETDHDGIGGTQQFSLAHLPWILSELPDKIMPWLLFSLLQRATVVHLLRLSPVLSWAHAPSSSTFSCRRVATHNFCCLECGCLHSSA